MKKKTRSVRIAKEDNTRAKKLFLILVGVLIWMSGLAIAVIIRKIIEGTSLNVLSVFQLLVLMFGWMSLLLGFPMGYLIHLKLWVNTPSYLSGN